MAPDPRPLLPCFASDARGNQGITIFANNALPCRRACARQMAANNIASFTMGRVGHSSDLAADAFTRNTGKTRSGTLGFKSEDRLRWVLQGLGDQRLLPVRQDRPRRRVQEGRCAASIAFSSRSTR